MHFYQLDFKLIYVHLVVHLSQMFLCEVLDLHLQIEKISLLTSHVICHFYSNIQCCLSHSAFQFASG